MGRTKFNVDKQKEARTYDGIVFDSQLEMRYYSEVIIPCVENGEIKNFELQKNMNFSRRSIIMANQFSLLHMLRIFISSMLMGMSKL